MRVEADLVAHFSPGSVTVVCSDHDVFCLLQSLNEEHILAN